MSNYLRAIETYQNATLENAAQDLKRRKYYGNLIGFSTTKNNFNQLNAFGADGSNAEMVNNYLPLIGHHQKMEFGHMDND